MNFFNDFPLRKFFMGGSEAEISEQRAGRVLFLIWVLWFLMWAILPLIALDNEFIDILENIVWGRHFQFGYDKNPYFGPWLTFLFYELTGKTLWVNYLLSQVFVLIGFFSVWRLARRMVSPVRAVIAVLGMIGIGFYGIKSVELCDDVMELGLWPLTIWFFYRALCDRSPMRDWLLTGLFAGIALMTKYYAGVLFLSMLGVLLFTPQGRAAFRHLPIYCAGMLFLLISLPNLIWLAQNDMVAVAYALERADLGSSTPVPLFSHIYQPWRAVSRAFGVICIPLILYGSCFFGRSGSRNEQESSFNTRFLWLMCWGPFGCTLLFSLITGGRSIIPG